MLTVMQIDIADHVFDECRWNNKCGSDSIAVSFTRRERATIGHRSCRGSIGTFARGAAGEERGQMKIILGTCLGKCPQDTLEADLVGADLAALL